MCLHYVFARLQISVSQHWLTAWRPGEWLDVGQPHRDLSTLWPLREAAAHLKCSRFLDICHAADVKRAMLFACDTGAKMCQGTKSCDLGTPSWRTTGRSPAFDSGLLSNMIMNSTLTRLAVICSDLYRLFENEVWSLEQLGKPQKASSVEARATLCREFGRVRSCQGGVTWSAESRVQMVSTCEQVVVSLSDEYKAAEGEDRGGSIRRCQRCWLWQKVGLHLPYLAERSSVLTLKFKAQHQVWQHPASASGWPLNPWGLHQVGPHGGPGPGVEIGSWSHDIPHLSQTWLLEIPGTSFSS